jgi:HD superfamily phosphohydrolase
LAIDDERFGEAESLILGSKAFQAAESYVLGLFHMYFAVYFHKATRSAEKLLTAVIVRVGEHCDRGDVGKTGLHDSHPLVKFIRSRELADYLKLDDFVIWASLAPMTDAEDPICSELATRLLERKLYKAVDIGSLYDGHEDKLVRFKHKLQKATADGIFAPHDVIVDQTNRTPYKVRGYETPEAMAKIHIRKQGSQEYEDLAKCSEVVNALKAKSIYRIYVRDEEVRRKVHDLTDGV